MSNLYSFIRWFQALVLSSGLPLSRQLASSIERRVRGWHQAFSKLFNPCCPLWAWWVPARSHFEKNVSINRKPMCPYATECSTLQPWWGSQAGEAREGAASMATWNRLDPATEKANWPGTNGLWIKMTSGKRHCLWNPACHRERGVRGSERPELRMATSVASACALVQECVFVSPPLVQADGSDSFGRILNRRGATLLISTSLAASLEDDTAVRWN